MIPKAFRNWRSSKEARPASKPAPRPKPPNKKREAIQLAFRAIKSWRVADGDYLEFGVFEGRAFVEAYRATRKHELDSMRLIAFDSFEGLPTPTHAELDFDHFYEGQYACSEADFLEKLRRSDVAMDRVTTVPGFFDKSLTPELKTKLNIRKASVVFVDCDLYESTACVLEFVTDIVDTGTIMIFDDWFSFAGDLYTGEIRATREWLERNSQFRLEHYRDFGVSGRIFVVQKVTEPL